MLKTYRGPSKKEKEFNADCAKLNSAAIRGDTAIVESERKRLKQKWGDFYETQQTSSRDRSPSCKAWKGSQQC